MLLAICPLKKIKLERQLLTYKQAKIQAQVFTWVLDGGVDICSVFFPPPCDTLRVASYKF